MRSLNHSFLFASIGLAFSSITIPASADTTSTLQAFFTTNIDPQMALCGVCHIPGGLADKEGGNGFMLTTTQSHYASFYQAWQTLGKGVTTNPLLTMNSNASKGHSGGQPWKSGTTIYTNVSTLLLCWDQPASCTLVAPDPSTLDNDGDGLTNAEEAQYGTNPDKADTDGDGRTDYEEIFIDGTDPLIADTNDTADLSVTMAGSNGKNNSGVIKYAITVTNDGPATASSIEITHTLPAAVTLASVTPTTLAFTTDGNELTFYLNSLLAGDSQKITVSVNTAADNKTKMDFTTSVSAVTEDPDLSNNSKTSKFGGSLEWLILALTGLLLGKRRIKKSSI